MMERRKERRLPAFLGGRIIFDRRQSSADCIIKNMSGSGARLALHDAPLVPDEFDLVVPHKQAEYRVRTAWRRRNEVGVKIVAAAAEQPLSLRQARRLQRLERENKLLRQKLALSEVGE